MELELYATKKYETVRELMRSIKILNVYQSGILYNTMHQISTLEDLVSGMNFNSN